MWSRVSCRGLRTTTPWPYLRGRSASGVTSVESVRRFWILRGGTRGSSLSKLNILARLHVYVVCVTRCFKYLPYGISLRSGTGGDGTPALL